MLHRLNVDNRLLIVLGMAQSGTTVFTHTLASHPSIYLHCDGSEAFLLENQCLKTLNLDELQNIATLNHDARYVLLNRPWQERHYAWFKAHLPRAKYFICIRNRADVIKSWRTTGSWAVCDHPGVRINAVSYYRQFKMYALIMQRILGASHCMLVQYGDIVKRRIGTFRQIADWRSVLLTTQWSVSMVG